MKLLFLGKPIWGPSSHHPRIRRKRSDTWNCKNGVPQQGIFQARIQRDLINVAGRTLQADQSSVGQSIHHVLQISGSDKIRSDWYFPIIFPIILPIKWFTKHDQNKWSPKPNIWWPWLQPPRCFSFSFSSCSSWWNMADKRNSHRSVKLFHVCLEHWSFDARLMFDGASCLVLMSFWLLVWWSFGGLVVMVRAPSLELAASCWTRPPSVSASVDPIFWGDQGGPMTPKSVAWWSMGKPMVWGTHHFVASNSAQESAEMLLDLLLQSLLLLQQCRILRLQLVNLGRSRPNQPPKSQGKIYIYTQANAEKKMINPFLMVPNCPCFFLKLSWVFLPVAPHWQNHLLEAVLWASRRTSSTTQPGRSQVGNPSWESKQTQWPNPSVFIKS